MAGDRDPVGVKADRGTHPGQHARELNVALQGVGEQTRDRHRLAGHGRRRQEVTARRGIGLDFEAARRVSARLDHEIIAVLGDLGPELPHHLDRHRHIGGRNQAGHRDREAVGGQRRGHQQSGQELGRNARVQCDSAAGQPVGHDGQRQVPVGFLVCHGDPEVAQRGGHRPDRAAAHLRGRVEAERSVPGGRQRREETGGRARVAAVNVGRRRGRSRRAAHEDPVLVGALHAVAEHAESVRERLGVVGDQRPPQVGQPGRAGPKEQGARGHRLRSRNPNLGHNAPRCRPPWRPPA